MRLHLVGLAATLALLGAGSSHAQVVPEECTAPATPGAVRLALLVADQNGIPFSGVGEVTMLGESIETGSHDESGTRFLEYWYCSAELPRGRYTVEVRTPTFDCTAITLPASESGLVVRMVYLLPRAWGPLPGARYTFRRAFDRQQEMAAALGSRPCGMRTG